MSTLYDLSKNHVEDLLNRLKDSEIKRIFNISIPHLALLLALSKKPFIAIENSAENASVLYSDLLFFRGILNPQQITANMHSLAYLPPLYDAESAGRRAKVMYDYQVKPGVSIITSEEACPSGLIPSGIGNSLLALKKGTVIERAGLEQWLKDKGYKDVSLVMEKGEYSQRGWIFDVYPSTEELPVRVEFFGDEVSLIRTFHIETQLSIREIEMIELFPSSENPQEEALADDMLSLMDIFINSECSMQDRLICGIEDSECEIVSFSHRPFMTEGIDSMEQTIKGCGILPEERHSIDDISAILGQSTKKTIVILPSEKQSLRLKEILSDGGVIAPVVEKNALDAYEGRFCITAGRLSSGINLGDWLVLTDREVFGERPVYRSLKKSKVSRLLLSMDDLRPGDFIVHKDHGIGRFIGLKRQKTDDYEEDLICIEYSNGRLFVPFQGIDRLQKYSSSEGHFPPLERLGGKTWQRTKQRVRERIREMAEKLLKLYAERKVARGFIFSEDTPLHEEFDDFFPYEETPDQTSAIDMIKKHMRSEMPMDMLLCGDVGYGKTEVAIRAAFRAAYDGKQVAVLVPTTLLAEQHFRTFSMRFSAFPVTINCLSRFQSRDETKKITEAVLKGETDIIIGTHMLLNKKIQFHELGLLIIDEEHRFGVAQKERLKELRSGADVLTLTATPIPRTLQMSLSGIREMCTIETPPEERLAVKSIVTTFNDRTIKEAIEREIKRGGQIFFVHNRIGDIEKMAGYIKRLVPETKVAIGHGRMREIELEKVMLDFLNRQTNVLVCTSIIGSGLDIPTANTIILDRADTFGLSDLYQLRGRVGRGNTQAYAYFLIPGENLVTEDAKKRLQAIQEMSYLGAGFRLALKDLEIRGAGNLLGPEQSGYINGVGFDMYMEMMEKAVAELKGQETKEEPEPQIKLRVSAFIPEGYIPDITLRLSIYKRISSSQSDEALSGLLDEMNDRFGVVPQEARNLVHVMKIKILARRLHILKIFDIDNGYRFIMVSEENNTQTEFFDRLLKVLSELHADRRSGVTVRFLKEGFELNTGPVADTGSLAKAEEVLRELSTRIDKKDRSIDNETFNEKI